MSVQELCAFVHCHLLIISSLVLMRLEESLSTGAGRVNWETGEGSDLGDKYKGLWVGQHNNLKDQQKQPWLNA